MNQGLSFEEVCQLIGEQRVERHQQMKQMKSLLDDLQRKNEELVAELNALRTKLEHGQ